MRCTNDVGYSPGDSILARLNFLLGKAFVAESRWTEAENALRKALTTVEELPELRLEMRPKVISLLADAYSRQGKTVQAEALKASLNHPDRNIPMKAQDIVGFKPSLLFIIDASLQTARPTGGITALDAAKAKVMNLLARSPADMNVGVRVLGGNVTGVPCRGETSILVPIGTENRKEATELVRNLKPVGNCPLSYGLKEALEQDMSGIQGPKAILLLADGRDTCGPLSTELPGAAVPVNLIKLWTTCGRSRITATRFIDSWQHLGYQRYEQFLFARSSIQQQGAMAGELAAQINKH